MELKVILNQLLIISFFCKSFFLKKKVIKETKARKRETFRRRARLQWEKLSLINKLIKGMKQIYKWII